jgi:hypothetical protein
MKVEINLADPQFPPLAQIIFNKIITELGMYGYSKSILGLSAKCKTVSCVSSRPCLDFYSIKLHDYFELMNLEW